MKGADEYYDLFPSGQYGRLYMKRDRLVNCHRGKIFHIFVLPADCKVDVATFNPYKHPAVVEVYGVVSSRQERPESYGWLIGGPWQRDFEQMVKIRNDIKEREENKLLREQMTRVKTDRQRKIDLLSDYKEGDSK